MKKGVVIANIRAGRQKIKHQLAEVLNLLNQAGYRCEVWITQYPHHALELAEQLDPMTDLVVVSGGDGTLNEVINGLMRGNLSIPLGYLPSGTTNDFATSMGIGKDCVKALTQLLNGSEVQIDIGRMAEHYFSYVASFGAFTESVYHTDQSLKNVLGYAAYLLEGAKSIVDIRPVKMKVITEALTLEEEYLFGAVANSTSIAGFLKLDQRLVRMNDGLFEVLLIRCPKDLAEIAKVANYINQRNYNNEFIRLIQTSWVKIECRKKVDWNFDGERVPGQRTMMFEVVPDGLRLRK